MSRDLIESVVVRPVLLPMPRPHRTASGEVRESPLVLVDVTSSQGVVGRSYVFTYSVAALVPTARLVQNLAGLIVGQELAPGVVDRVLTGALRLLGPQGLTGIAAAALDMAVWDGLARAAGLPLVRILGGVGRPMAVYAGIGFDGPSGCAAQAEEWVARGVTALKVKIGYPTLAEDLEVLQGIRSAVGPDVHLMVDYNQCLDLPEARRRLRVLDDQDLVWVEEPVTAHDFHALATLAHQIRTPLQAGENWWGPGDFATAVALGASDHLMPDVMKVGGVTGWMRVAGLAHARGLPISNHLFPEISAHLMCATPTARWFEYADWWNAILDQPLRLDDGHAVLDETSPGNGITWDEHVVTRYLAT